MNYNAMIHQDNTLRNHEGEIAFKESPEMELYTAVVTTAMSDNFYEDRHGRAERIARLVRKVNPYFVAQLAVYARTEMNLRSVPMLLLVELAKCHNGDDLVSRAVAKTVLRADEIMELLTCYQWRNPQEGRKKLGKLSRQIQNGLQRAFNRFDEYGFAKYNKDKREVKLRDALFLVHPKAKSEAQQEIFNRIVKDELEVPYTWETELSTLGQQIFETPEARAQAFKAKWEELIASGQLGYMAMMRNLRNMLEANVSDAHVTTVCRHLADPESVARSRQFPFRFLSAYREIGQVASLSSSKVMSALEKAVVHSAQNITGFSPECRVLLACDVSGSMQRPVSARSKVECYDIGLMLAMLLKSRCEQVVSGIFGDTWKAISLPSEGILANTLELHHREGEVGYSTNGYKVIDWLIEKNLVMDKVLIFTDCQMWDSNMGGHAFHQSWTRYKAIAPSAKLYLFDLSGYGNTPVSLNGQDVCLVSGWSDMVFDVLDAIENGDDSLAKIREIEI